MTQEVDDSDLFDGFGNGSLHMYVVCTPSWTPYKEGDARYIDMDFHYADQETLFFIHRTGRQSEFPLISEIDGGLFQDFIFEPPRASELKRECERLKAELSDPDPTKALRKLIYGCDQALAANCNLMLVCD
jgi:hypothetical protein